MDELVWNAAYVADLLDNKLAEQFGAKSIWCWHISTNAVHKAKDPNLSVNDFDNRANGNFYARKIKSAFMKTRYLWTFCY